MIYVGTAAWTIPKIASELFPEEGSHLERYSSVLNAVEINSSFYKDHMSKSYARWRESTPDNFKFSIKLNKRFTHECNLNINEEDLLSNLEGISALKEKWEVLLLQFPGKLLFDKKKMATFYQIIREVYQGKIALEARNTSWIDSSAKKLMNQYDVSKVMADPEKCPGKAEGDFQYYRLHGSPEIYKSNYEEDYLNTLYNEMDANDGDSWCIFDNTTFGYATQNAITILEKGESNERHPRIHDHTTTTMHAFNEY